MENKIKECSVDAAEYRLNFYIEDMERFIDEYGYKKEIAIVNKDTSIVDLENILLKFLKENSKGLDFMEILGTLKDFEDSEVYVCCYEPYGDEIFCVELKDEKVFFFNTKDYKNDIKMSDINYIERNY